MRFIATTKLGLESVTAFQLKKMDLNDVQSADANVSFSGSFEDMARALLYLRTAERLLLEVGSFEAATFEALFEGVKAIDWKPYLTPHSRIHVNGKSAKSTLFSVSDCQSIAKKAIVESLKAAYHTDRISEDGAEVIVEVGLLRNKVTVALDCCGAGLSRRGYRTYNVAAPLSETLGAGLILLSRYWPDTPFIDPMCGSGTMPIEAAMIGNNRAPSLNRRFAAEDWPYYARQRARDEERHDELPVFGYDIDERSVAVARRHAEKAGVKVHWEVRPVQKLTTSYEKGLLLCNPPYGERMLTGKEAADLYRDMRRRRPRTSTGTCAGSLTAFPAGTWASSPAWTILKRSMGNAPTSAASSATAACPAPSINTSPSDSEKTNDPIKSAPRRFFLA